MTPQLKLHELRFFFLLVRFKRAMLVDDDFTAGDVFT